MKHAGRIWNGVRDSRPGLPKRLLLVALAVAATFQGVTIAFSQEEVTPDISERASTTDLAASKVLQIPKGSFVEVELSDGGAMRGKLGELLGDGFLLRSVTRHHLITREVRFAEVRSIQLLDNPKTKGQAFDTGLSRAREIAGLVVVGVSTVLLIAIVTR